MKPAFFLLMSGIRESNPPPRLGKPVHYRCANSAYNKSPDFLRADTRTRTGDLRITNALLYQLSHIGKLKERSCSKADAKTVQIECRELALMPRRSPFSQFDCKDTTKIPFSKIFDYNFITLILILQQSGGTDTAQRLGSHLQITGDIDQRCTEHELRTALHELGITVLRRLEAQHVSMDL